jgi:hypothetical protein
MCIARHLALTLKICAQSGWHVLPFSDEAGAPTLTSSLPSVGPVVTATSGLFCRSAESSAGPTPMVVDALVPPTRSPPPTRHTNPLPGPPGLPGDLLPPSHKPRKGLMRTLPITRHPWLLSPGHCLTLILIASLLHIRPPYLPRRALNAGCTLLLLALPVSKSLSRWRLLLWQTLSLPLWEPSTMPLERNLLSRCNLSTMRMEVSPSSPITLPLRPNLSRWLMLSGQAWVGTPWSWPPFLVRNLISRSWMFLSSSQGHLKRLTLPLLAK